MEFPNEIWLFDSTYGKNHAFLITHEKERVQTPICTVIKGILGHERQDESYCRNCETQIMIMKRNVDWHTEE